MLCIIVPCEINNFPSLLFFPFFPGVGQNLQDHLEVYIQQKCTKPITLYNAQKPVNMVRIGLEWLWKFTGMHAVILPLIDLELLQSFIH